MKNKIKLKLAFCKTFEIKNILKTIIEWFVLNQMKWLDGEGNGLLPWRSRFKSWWKLPWSMLYVDPYSEHRMLTICIYNVFMRNINWIFELILNKIFQISNQYKNLFRGSKNLIAWSWKLVKKLTYGGSKSSHRCWWFKDEELIANLWSNNLSIFFSIRLNFSSI